MMRVETEPERVLTRPKRSAISPVAVARFEFVVLRVFVRVTRFELMIPRFPERLLIFPVAVARNAFVLLREF